MEENLSILPKEFADLIDETTKFDFPFFSSEKKKNQIIEDKKKYIEDKFAAIAKHGLPEKEILEQAWSQALVHAEKEFNSLPMSTRINGFYVNFP